MVFAWFFNYTTGYYCHQSVQETGLLMVLYRLFSHEQYPNTSNMESMVVVSQSYLLDILRDRLTH